MTRSRVVPALLVAVSSFFAAPPARAAYDAFRTAVTFSKAVQLADGTTLKANVPYEFQLNFAGTGKTAEFEFILPGGKHVKHPAEAVGFIGSATGGAGSGKASGFLKYEYKYYEWIKMNEYKGKMEYKEVKVVPQDAAKYKEFEGDIKDAQKADKNYIKIKLALPAGQASTESFSWGVAGFGVNSPPTVTEERGLIIVVCKSSNSPAFFRAQFTEVKPGGKK
jgi:hypothetical protein